MARDLLPQPSILADMFAKVPQIADLVVKDLDPDDTVNLMMKTDPALTSFCQVEGGGLDRFLKISQEGKYERRLLRRMPSIPRLLAKEWREKLLGKRLIAENAQTDDTVSLSRSWLTLSALPALFGFSLPSKHALAKSLLQQRHSNALISLNRTALAILAMIVPFARIGHPVQPLITIHEANVLLG